MRLELLATSALLPMKVTSGLSPGFAGNSSAAGDSGRSQTGPWIVSMAICIAGASGGGEGSSLAFAISVSQKLRLSRQSGRFCA